MQTAVAAAQSRTGQNVTKDWFLLHVLQLQVAVLIYGISLLFWSLQSSSR